MKNMVRLCVLMVAASVIVIAGSSYSLAESVTFPGGSVTWGNYESGLTYPGGDINLGRNRSNVNIPGGVGVNWDSLGRGGVNINIPGSGFRTNIRW